MKVFHKSTLLSFKQKEILKKLSKHFPYLLDNLLRLRKYQEYTDFESNRVPLTYIFINAEICSIGTNKYTIGIINDELEILEFNFNITLYIS